MDVASELASVGDRHFDLSGAIMNKRGSGVEANDFKELRDIDTDAEFDEVTGELDVASEHNENVNPGV